ncbi:MAG: GH116 family glycosyl hydrolase [Gemmatimonadota bacterium]
MRLRLLFAASVVFTAAAEGQASAPAAPPSAYRSTWFDLGRSPIELRGPARSGVYLASVGRRAIAMGSEDGRFELWSWPYKWLHDFQLSFRVPKYTAPIRGADVARWVTVRPEGVTIEYAYETFTVKQHVFAVLDQPATIMLLEVDALRPLEIVATFAPDVHLAWPASLGGQYIAWNAAAKAFIFSESRRTVNAFLGSPAITKASDVPAHMLSAALPQFVIAVGDAGQQYTEPRLGEPPGGNVNIRDAYIPIVMAGGEMPRDSAHALYDRLMAPGAARREWQRRVAHFDSLRAQTVRIVTPDSALNRAVEWAKVNLDESMVCNPDLGCGLVAGFGLSGVASDRPGFGWFFGGDAAINSFAMSGIGERAQVRDGVFRFFAKYQRADGKITHEISQGAGKIDWFGAYPYAYYHGDTTPFWVLAFGEYWKQTADTALVRELWPNLRKAYEWSRRADSDGDGLMENTIAGAGALELGDLQTGIVSDVYLSGVWVAALERFARIADAMREPKLAAEARATRAKALTTLEQMLWMPSVGQYAFAILEGQRVNENLTAWPATAMSFDVFDATRGAAMAARLASNVIMTDWGARPLAASSPLFDPLHYNNGAVWPFVTGWVALAEYRYHNAHAGRFALDAIARTGFDESLGRNPEVISGRLYKPLDTAVPHQFFATSMVLTPLVRGLLGLEVDAPAGRVRVAPHMPAEWDTVRVEHVAVGESRLTLRLVRRGRTIALRVAREGIEKGTPIVVEFAPALPVGARDVRRDEGGVALASQIYPGAVVARDSVVLGDQGHLSVAWSGGWEVSPPRTIPRIGDRSTALRVVSERMEGNDYHLRLEGRAGASYAVRVRAPEGAPSSVTVLPANATMMPLRMSEPDHDGWVTLTVEFPSQGGDADDYIPLEFVFVRN